MAGVRLEHVYKRYKGQGGQEVTAVKDVTFDIKDREFLVLVGPSGCGKTTTLRMIAGLEEISDGAIYIGDRIVNDVPPKDRDIAMVFQSYALYPHMSVYDNMAFGLKLRHTPKDEITRRVKEASAILGLDTYLDRKPKALSGGQRQRVALGRAIVRDPKVFLMDEPLSNLDAKLRVQTRSEISKLHQRLGATVVYVTHDQVEAMTMGSRIAVMKDGIVQQLDAPQNVYDHPANKFVAGFIGSPSMNFFDAKIVQENGKVSIAGDSFRVAVPERLLEEIRPLVGRDVIFGIRPEHMEDADVVKAEGADPTHLTALQEGTTVPMKVDVVEHMGNELMTYLSLGKNPPIVARVKPSSKVVPGNTMNVLMSLENMHLFDKSDERVLF